MIERDEPNLATATLEPSPASVSMWQMCGGLKWVYFHLASDATVLYVGATCQPTVRLKQHRTNSQWYGQIAEIRYLGPLPVYHAARLEERLIQQHRPVFNRQHRRSAAVQPSDLPARRAS